MILIGIRMLTLNCFHVDSKYYDQENAKYQNKVSFIVVWILLQKEQFTFIH